MTAADAVNWPSGSTLLALTSLILLIVTLVGFCLVDLVRAPSVRCLPKPGGLNTRCESTAPFAPVAPSFFTRLNGTAGDGVTSVRVDEPAGVLPVRSTECCANFRACRFHPLTN